MSGLFHLQEVDLEFLEQFGNRDKYEIPNCPTVGRKFIGKVLYYYDPSKFWIIPKIQELQIFQRYLFKFYYLRQKTYKMLKEKIKRNDYCVAFVYSAFCRGVIIHHCSDYLRLETLSVLVFFIDYGSVESIDVNDLYYMADFCFKVPKFAIRASLACVGPPCGDRWSKDAVECFAKSCFDKKLCVVVTDVDFTHQVFSVCLSEVGAEKLVHELLVEGSYARYLDEGEKVETSDNKLLYESQMRFLYLFPSQKVLENGEVANPLVVDLDYGLQVAPLGQMKPYFKEKDENVEN